jgi:hypothetical protein
MRTEEELLHCDSEMNERVWKTRLLGVAGRMVCVGLFVRGCEV